MYACMNYDKKKKKKNTIHINMNIYQLGTEKKFKTYMNVSPINIGQNICHGK